MFSLRRADRLLMENQYKINPQSDSKSQRGIVPPRSLSLACGLVLSVLSAVETFFDESEVKTYFAPFFDEVGIIINRWARKDDLTLSASPAKIRSETRELLRKHLEEHSYPLAHRLLGLKILADDAAFFLLFQRAADEIDIEGTQAEEKKELKKSIRRDAYSHLEELHVLSEVYESPLHFPPLFVGFSQSLFAIIYRLGWATPEGEGDGTSPEDPNSLICRARANLERSREIVTMGRAYYDVISELFYLYDDFNDRLVHYNHAIQMFGSDVGQELEAWLAFLSQEQHN